jgi:pimeloyl-ACP methyl ester carboxylesterase
MRIRLVLALAVVVALAAPALPAAAESDIFDRVDHGYADNNGVRIHYATLGRRGRLVVMIHGFPDFWYTWRDQMRVLSHRYRVVAIDQRGYNLSDRPAGVDAYNLATLAEDVAAVIRATGEEHAVIVGHDWGGAVAWVFSILHPEMTDGLIILNLPHPRAMYRELRNNPAQQAASQYARDFQAPGSHLPLPPEALAAWVTDPSARAHYVEALGRSDPEAMLNYYRANYPREPYDDPPLPDIQVPVLMFHGLADPFLLPGATDGTWQWITKPFTLVTVPGAGHLVQQDASALVTRRMAHWLATERLAH